MKGCVGQSDFTQRIRLEAGAERLEFEMDVDWRELHRLLKVGFPVDVYTDTVYNEMQFGYVERPVHRSRLYDQDRLRFVITAIARFAIRAMALRCSMTRSMV